MKSVFQLFQENYKSWFHNLIMSNKDIFVTQSIKHLVHGCLPREIVIDYIDFKFKPCKVFKTKFRSKLADRLLSRLSYLRISLNRITMIHIERNGSCYLVHLEYLSRRWRLHNEVIMLY